MGNALSVFIYFIRIFTICFSVGPNAASNEAWTEWAKGYIDSSSHSRSRPAYTSSRSTYNKYPSPHRRRSRSTSRSRTDYKDSYYKDSYDRNYTPDRHVDKKYKEKHDKSYYDDERVGKVSKKKHDKSEKRKHKNDSKKEKSKSKSEKTSKKRKEKVSQSTTSDSNTESRPPRVKKSKTDSVSQKSKHGIYLYKILFIISKEMIFLLASAIFMFLSNMKLGVLEYITNNVVCIGKLSQLSMPCMV